MCIRDRSKEDLLAFADKLKCSENQNNNSKPLSEVLQINDVITLLGLARQTIYGLTSRRAIPFYKRNKKLYFKRSEILAWIEEGRKKTQVEFDEDVAEYIKRNKKNKI